MMTRFRIVAAALIVVVVAGAAPAQQDLSAVQIKATKLADNLYTLEGSGGTIATLVGPDGVFLVDSQFAQLTDKIVAAIKQITDRPIRFLVNTHQHPDHTGGNENFGKLGVTLISRDELRGRLAAATGRGAVPPAALPLLTYRGGVTLHMNGEEVRIIGMIDGFNAVIELATPRTRIVPGHGAVVDEKAVAEHRDLAMALRDRVAGLIKKGQTQEQILATKPTADYDARVPAAGTTGERFVGQLYAELGGK
jgi:glyoxylase-like metal-dependent hydrolase (beta-lactamase superfamily II)